MIVWEKNDLWIGCKVQLSDGRLAIVESNHENHEMVNVECEGEEFPVYIGETFDGSVYAQTILEGQSVDPEPEPEINDFWAFMFDGVDPDTFDGDLVDLL